MGLEVPETVDGPRRRLHQVALGHSQVETGAEGRDDEATG